MKVIEMWKQQVVKARRLGWPESTCAESARVSQALLKTALATDADFKAQYDEASRNAGKPPRF